MANFYDVHQKAIDQADGRLRVGEIWCVVMREPLRMVMTVDTPPIPCATIVQFRALPRGGIEPASSADHKLIADWNKRNEKMSLESFGPPRGIFPLSEPSYG